MMTRWHSMPQKEFVSMLETINPTTLMEDYPPLELLQECINRFNNPVDTFVSYGDIK